MRPLLSPTLQTWHSHDLFCNQQLKGLGRNILLLNKFHAESLCFIFGHGNGSLSWHSDMRHLVESCTLPEYGFFNNRLFTVIDAIVLQVCCEVLPTYGMCHLCLKCVNAVVCMKLCSVCG